MDQSKIEQNDCTLPKPLRFLSHFSGTASLIYLILFLLLHTRVSYDLQLSTQMSLTILCVVMVLWGFHWGRRSLPDFDPFGIRPRRTAQNEKRTLKIAGPYRFVRHPLYFFVLVLIWCTTIPTTDRVLFNWLWTGWIFLGTWLEEKDLVVFFGKDYHIYQKEVPMLIPFRFTQFFQPENKENQ